MIKKNAPNNFQELVEQHAGLSYEKQGIFGNIIGSNSWQVDLPAQRIYFGDAAFVIQVIGSLAFGNQSWLWGWGNTQSGIPAALLQQAQQLKTLGATYNIPELTDRSYVVEDGFEHKIGMMAAGIFQAKSYYCANYGQGTLVVTIQEPEGQSLIPPIELQRVERILTTFPQLIQSTPLNHKNTFINYLIDRQLDLTISDQTVVGTYQQHHITATFDEADRLLQLDGQLHPS